MDNSFDIKKADQHTFDVWVGYLHFVSLKDQYFRWVHWLYVYGLCWKTQSYKKTLLFFFSKDQIVSTSC